MTPVGGRARNDRMSTILRENRVFFGGLLLSLAVGVASTFFAVPFAANSPPGVYTLYAYFAYSIFIVLFCYTFIAALGSAVLQRLVSAPPKLGGVESFLLQVGVGASTLAVVAQLLGVIGLFRPLCLAAVLLLSFPYLIAKYANRLNASSTAESVPCIYGCLLVVTVMPLVVPAFVSLLPVIDWDEASYHLPTVLELFKRGWLESDPARFPLNFPLGIHLLYAYPLSLGSDASVRLFNLGSGLMLLAATFALAQRIFADLDLRRWALPVLSIALLASCPIVWEVCTTARIEVFVAFWLVLGFLAWQIGRTEDSAYAKFLTFLFFGMAAGAKTTGLIFVAVPLFVLVLSLRNSCALLIAAVLFLLPSGFWYLRNAVIFSAPLYPVSLSTLRVEPSVDGYSIFGVTDSCPRSDELSGAQFKEPALQELAGVVQRARPKSERITLRDLPQLILSQRMFERKPLHTFNLLIAVGLLSPLLWLTARWRKGWVLIVALLSGAVYFLILSTQLRIIRYLIPLLPFLSIAAAAVLLSIFGSLSRYKLGRLLSALVVSGLCLFCLMLQARSHEGKLGLIRFKEYLQGRQSQLDFVSENGFNYHNHSYGELVRFMESLSFRPKALLVSESKSYFFDFDYIPDHEQLGRYGITWLRLLARAKCEMSEVERIAVKDGITHLILNHGVLRHTLAVDPPADLERLKQSTLSMFEFLDQRGRLVLTTPDYLVWEISESIAAR